MVLFTAEKEQNEIELFDLIEQQFPDSDEKAIARASQSMVRRRLPTIR